MMLALQLIWRKTVAGAVAVAGIKIRRLNDEN
jgi:hypothetical protein